MDRMDRSMTLWENVKDKDRELESSGTEIMRGNEITLEVHSMRTAGRGWTSGECHNFRDEPRERCPENKSHHTGLQFLMRWYDFNYSF